MLTVVSVKAPFVPKFISVSEVTFGATYTSGGEAFTPEKAGLQTLEFVIAQLIHGDAAEESELFQGDVYYKEEKLHLLDIKTGAELASAKKTGVVKALVLSFGAARAK